MQIKGFDWDDLNRDHIAQHGVEPEETEEAFLGRRLIFRSYASRYVLLGRSAAGRHLIVAFAFSASMARVITARDMTKAEKQRYRRG
ncbi:MAG: BrnT family toxin [Elusimicrobia bacterium]|nr:BrnT family toxin [Elusimicrobiota bacterium]